MRAVTAAGWVKWGDLGGRKEDKRLGEEMIIY